MKRWTLLTWARAWHARVTPLHWKRSGSKRTFLQNKISNENVWFHTYILIITCCCCCFFLMDSIVRITFGTKRCCSCYILKKKILYFVITDCRATSVWRTSCYITLLAHADSHAYQLSTGREPAASLQTEAENLINRSVINEFHLLPECFANIIFLSQRTTVVLCAFRH